MKIDFFDANMKVAIVMLLLGIAFMQLYIASRKEKELMEQKRRKFRET